VSATVNAVGLTELLADTGQVVRRLPPNGCMTVAASPEAVGRMVRNPAPQASTWPPVWP